MGPIYAKADDPSQPTPPGAVSLQDAIAAAAPGTTIHLLPGRFTAKVRIERRHGAEGAPIVIRGAGQDTVIDGQVDPVGAAADRAGLWPRQKRAYADLRRHQGRKAPFFRVIDSSWIEWRDLFVENCWPYVFNVTRCHHLTVAGCDVVGATYVFYMKDAGESRPSHHMLFEGNRWCQDPTGSGDPFSSDPTGRKSWEEWTWKELKNGKSFMNGGFVGGADMAGGIVIRRNTLRFAFNAIHLEVEEDQSKRRKMTPEERGSAPIGPDDTFNFEPPDLSRNTNVEIYDNTIAYIRDNAVEPEYGATNWWVWNNRIDNAHKPMSIHNNGGGFWYFFGNTGGNDVVPPAQVNRAGGRRLGGKTFKFFYGPPFPHRNCFAFHNSWRPRGGVVTGGEMRHFHHFNNAVQHCASADPSAQLHCAPTLRFSEDHSFLFMTGVEPLGPEAVNRFDRDVSNGADFPDGLGDPKQEPNGRKAETPIFDPAGRADFRLATHSPARGLAAPVTLRAGIDWPASETWTSSDAPDAGAIQPNGRFKGPAFAHFKTRHYKEAPRLVAVETGSGDMALVFSVPLDPLPDGADPADVEILVADGRRLTPSDWSVAGRRLRLELSGGGSISPPAGLRLPSYLTGGLDGDSLPVTAWAAVVPITLAAPASTGQGTAAATGGSAKAVADIAG